MQIIYLILVSILMVLAFIYMQHLIIRKMFIESLYPGDAARYENLNESYEVKIVENNITHLTVVRETLLPNGEIKTTEFICHKSELYPL